MCGETGDTSKKLGTGIIGTTVPNILRITSRLY